MHIFIPHYGTIVINKNEEKIIYEQFMKVKLFYHIPFLKKLFSIITTTDLKLINKKINKQNAKKILNILEPIYQKYNIEYTTTKILTPKKYKKENKDKINLRVKRFREKSKKVSLQIMLDKEIKNNFDKMKKVYNLTSAELLKDLMNLSQLEPLDNYNNIP
jgi:hypothetical protein